MFEYFREKIPNNGILFLQETHFSNNTVVNLRDGFKGGLFFSNGTTNSCGVMIGYLGREKVILPGDFNLFYDPSLEASGGKAALKKNLNTFANN